MKLIPLTQGLFAKVSDADFKRVSAFNWYAQRSRRRELVYASRDSTVDERAAGAPSQIKMHQYLTGFRFPNVDHRNGDGLDNQRRNLRDGSGSKNGYNSPPRLMWKGKQCSSQFKGVSFHKRDEIWQAELTVAGRRHRVGTFDSEIAAARAYNTAARRLQGRYARLNTFDNCLTPCPQ